MRYRRSAFLASLFLLTPAVVLIVVGILVLVYRRAGVDIAFGTLILTFCALLVLGTVVLVVTLKRSADLSRLQADFLSKVSHDFRTPLTSIRMFVETLREGRVLDPEQNQRLLTLLSQETERLSTMIDRLLDFARLEAGKMRYQRSTVTAQAIVTPVLARFEPRTHGQDVILACELDKDLPAISVDLDAMQDVVQNLLDNAFKYTADPKRISVSVRKAPKLRGQLSHDEIEIAVADNGQGIARAEHRRIFDQFYRVDDRLARATEGSGLGLAISQHIVHAHGGRIRVESAPAHGATFIVTLPAAPQAPAATALAAEIAHPSRQD